MPANKMIGVRRVLKIKRAKAPIRLMSVFLAVVILQGSLLTWHGATPGLAAAAAEAALASTGGSLPVQLEPVEDTYVNAGGNAGKNFGSSNLLIVKNFEADVNLNRQAYMKFDLSSITGEIGSVKLKAYAVDNENSTIAVQAYGMEDSSWQEDMVTWNNKPEIDHYLSSENVGKIAGWHEWDVTSFVKQQLAKGDIVSIALIQQAAKGHSVSLNSKEHTDNHPYLEISVDRAEESAPSWSAGASLQATNITENGLQLDWDAASDTVGVTGYAVYQNGVLLGKVSGGITSYTVTGLTVGQKYTFKVEAGNAQNSWSSDGPFVTVRTPTTELIQLRPGNIYTNGEAVRFKVQTARPAVSWAVYDYQGALAQEGTAATVQNEAAWTVPHLKHGYFTLQVRADLDGSDPVLLKTPFAVLAPRDEPTNEASPFGVSTHLHRLPQNLTSNIVDLIKAAGIRTVRGGYEWRGIEKQQGSYTFTPQPDYYMNMLNKDDFDFLFVSGYTNPFYDNDSTPYTDAGREGFANFMKAYVDHYQDQLDVVEVYNEFYGSFGDRGNGPADSKPEYYYPLLKKTYETLKASHPDLPVLGTSTVGDLKWIEAVFKLGGMQYMDGFSIHPYLYPGAPEGYEDLILNLKDLIREYNNGNLKPIWINETGWPTERDARGVDEKTQANYLIRANVVALANGVEKIVWYDMINDGIQNINEDNFGLLRNPDDKLGSLTPKPAYTAYATMTQMLNAAMFASRDATDSDIRSYVFQKTGGNVRVIWSTADSSIPAAIHTSTPIQITDMMGNTSTYTPYNGNVFVTLSNEPFFVVGEVNGIERDSTFVLSGEEARIGDSLVFTLETNNTDSDDFAFQLAVEDQIHPVVTPSGQQAVQTIEVASGIEPGSRLVTAVLLKGNDRVGLLRSGTSTLPPYTVQIRPMMEEPDLNQTLRVAVNNESKSKAMQLQKVDWRFGTQSGTEIMNEEIAAGSSAIVDIPLASMSIGITSSLKVTVYIDGLEPYTYEGTAEFNPVPARSVTVDGTLDPETLNSASTIDLSKGTVKMSGYQGAGDLSGQVWLSYDADHLYLSARIKDDTHTASMAGADIWNNDSLQFAISDGLPGEKAYWHEIGISQTPEGPQSYRWMAPPGVDKGPLIDSQLAITRDEELKYTIYELALPWSEIEPVRAENHGVISFSMLVNDNDGAGRKGFIEWGGGIGDGKLSSKFRSMQWMALAEDMVPPETSLNMEGTERNGWYISEVRAVLKAADETSGVAETVYSLDNGKTWLSYKEPLTFTEDGTYTLTYRSMDRAGNIEETQEVIFRIDRTAPTASIRYSTTEPTREPVTATMIPSEPVTITNNDGNDSYTFSQNGSFTFEFIDAAGHEGSATAVAGNIIAAATGVPGQPKLSSDNGYDTGIMDGSYRISMNLWWGNNGTDYILYENGVPIDRQALKDDSPNAQSAVTAVFNKPNGTYEYVAELTNAFGTTRSDVLVVTVNEATPGQPVLSHDHWDGDGSYKVSMNMWWGTNGSTYRLYENDVLIDTQTLINKTPQAQSAITEIREKSAGTYVYWCELINDAGTVSSGKITVIVK